MSSDDRLMISGCAKTDAAPEIAAAEAPASKALRLEFIVAPVLRSKESVRAA
jgi:hypothetical protein